MQRIGISLTDVSGFLLCGTWNSDVFPENSYFGHIETPLREYDTVWIPIGGAGTEYKNGRKKT